MSGYTTVAALLDYMELESADEDATRKLGGLIDRVSSLMDRVLDFTFELEPGTLILDGPGAVNLYLPAPGAHQILDLSEGGVTLDASAYELQPRYGQYLLRLDANGQPTNWTDRPRAVVLDYVPSIPPAGIEEICIEVCVRRWQGKTAGYEGAIGVEGQNTRYYTYGFTRANMADLERISRQYGVRNVVAV